MTNKKILLTLAGIYLFLYVFNYLHPLNFGDDYIYAFVWQGNPMSVPLTEDAVRIDSLKDIFVSQWLHYFTWGGRTVAHVLVQFFLWSGKNLFNILNAFIGVLLVTEIYWCICKGRLSLDFKPELLFWIFLLLWSFTPAFSSVFFWLSGSCNYLWSNTFLLAFLIPFIHKYYRMKKEKNFNLFFVLAMFFGGIVAGWTNENSVCWILLFVFLFIFMSWKLEVLDSWMVFGASGLLIGYALLMLAPGNVVRLNSGRGMNWFTSSVLRENLQMLLTILTFQLFLWYFNLRSIAFLIKMKLNDCSFAKDFLLVKVLCTIAFAATAIMFFSPVFPARSGFFSTVLLIIAAGILLRVQNEFAIGLMKTDTKKILFNFGIVFFAISTVVSLNNYYKIHLQMQNIIQSAKQMNMTDSNEILTVESFKKTSILQDIMSGYHIPNYELSEDENDWKNVDFARYYGIKGIRMTREMRKP